MTRDLHGKVALVTGSSTGIGRAIAIALAARGSDIVVSYRKTSNRAEETAEGVREHGARALIVKADVTQKDEVDALFSRAHGALGKVDFLVNGAGTMVRREPFLEAPVELWDEVFAVNVRGTFLCCQAALREMVKRERGKIVNISSSHPRRGGQVETLPFEASKAAVDALTLALSREYAPYGITVNAVAPGVIDTPFHKKYTSPEVYEDLLRATPAGRAGTAEEVATLVAHLLSPAGDPVTGQVIAISGER